MKKQETFEEAAEKYANELPEPYNYGINPDKKKGFIEGVKWQQEPEQFFNDDRVKTLKRGLEYLLKKQERMYSEEDMRKAHSIGWITRERFDDLSPDIVYPKGLDYEEKQDYAFNLWFKKFKKR